MTATAPRRGSFLRTWRLFASGGAAFGVISPIGLVAMCAVFLVNGRSVPFAAFAFLVLFLVAFETLVLESFLADRLAFMTLVPQPVDARWLVLVPMCALGVVGAILMAVLGQPPVIASLALLGLAWWTAGSLRFIPKLPAWPLLAFPVLLLPLVATYVAHRAGGWGVAAAVGMVFGLLALALQPRITFDTASPASPARTSRSRASAAIRQGAVSRAGGVRAIWLASAVRFLLISTAQLRRFSLLMFLAGLAFAAIQAVPGFALFVLVMFVPSSPLTRAYAREVFEFIRPLPFSRGRRFVGGVLIPLLSTLAVPLVMTAAIDLDWINSGGLMAWFVKGDTHASTLRYLREAMGATFLPETWPPGGLTPEMWARLRPLLWLDLLRIAAIVVAALFGGSVLAGPRSLWLSALVSMVVKVGAVICAIRLSLGDIFGVPVPPLWFALLLAAVAVGNWTWCARVVNLPDAAAGPPATGSSTAG